MKEVQKKMFELIKLEWTKLCRRRITIIVTLCCFAGTIVFFLLPFLQFKAWDENGTMLAGKEAVSYRHEVYDKILSGLLTEERITGDIKEYQEIMAKLTELNSRFEEKVGRNDPCPCGSGLKYKKCCGKYR